ncbi:ABC transporter ATP-binding protein/permease [Paenibacillus sp. MER TA 81-3]|uniref:ABC transporter ATP-binding protein n=1 Tax=Paenibacillus sp. MER TA 81-3 TaxID=2939573 RepID=UPI00203CD789|nr:ABC transporter ATP-binding protein [Paenibacillus sp. MER TA 81-3]MCM3340483.1 ABC transporter ATP-binding protein/permease [Paenibacillus sp. MER TA 81-3]
MALRKRKDVLTLWKSARWLSSFVKPHMGWMIVGIISAVAAAIIEIWTGSLIEQLTTNAGNGDGQLVARIVYTVFIVIAIGVPAKYFMVYGIEKSSAQAMRDLRNQMMKHIGKLPVHYLEKKHSGDMVSRVTNDLQIINQFMIRDVAEWFYHPLLFIGCFGYLLWIRWELVLLSLLLVPVSLFVSQWVGKQLQRLTEEAQENMGQMNVILQDTLSGMPLVKSYLLQGILFRSYQSLLLLTLKKRLAVNKREAIVTPVLFTLMISPIVFAILYGSYLISKGLFSTGELIAFLYLLNLCLEPLQNIPTLITNTFEMTGALKRAAQIMNQPIENEEGHCIVRTAQPPIAFHNVNFAYENSGSPLLRNLSFTVAEGQTVALVGASGGGKSTVIKLLCGFYPLQADGGKIDVFGQSIRDCNPKELRSHLSVVTQDSYLFSGTIADNIAYGRENASMDEVIEAAKSANAHSFIMELPEGYQTDVGERGALLSGGQRQRITIARALLKDAPILLLDEPTSALDTESESLVQEALNVLMKERTTIVIAHRLSTIQNADEIWVMEDGRIEEAGNHAKLLEKKGSYARLYHQEFETDRMGSKEVAYT